MKIPISSKHESDDSVDTDTTDDKLEKLKSEPTFWDFLPFFNIVPYIFVLYICWYLLDHNTIIVLWCFYVFIPIIDIILPIDEKNLSLKQVKIFEKDKRFLIPLYVYLTLEFFTFIWAIYTFTYGEFYGIIDRILFIYTISHFAALEIAIGHELMHRRELVHKIFGTLAYSKVLYSHFFIEHIKGHHKHVATPLDPATSELGEHLYEFFPRSFFGSYKSVWKYETERLSKRDMSGFMKLLNNRLISFNIGHIIYMIVINYIFGYMGLIFVLAYSFISVFMLESINYIEHYGLQRSKDENGIYEPINIKHSWNAPHRYTNYIIFKLQRHSDHHANAYKPYQILNSFKDSPTMLGGYSLALFTAYCPPVWFKAYDPIVKAVKDDRDITPEELKKCESIIYKYLAFVSVCLTTSAILKFYL